MAREERVDSTSMGRIALSACCFLALCGCASTVPGNLRVGSGWDGNLSGRLLGVYLMTDRKPFTVAQFECLSQGDEVLKDLDPGIRWTQVDSGSKGVRALGGWDLDSLGDLLAADSGLWAGGGGAATAPSGTLRSALSRVGTAYGTELLLVVRPGAERNARDSGEQFRDRVWFGLFSTASGERLLSVSGPVQGSRSGSRSAESDWAREAWRTFAKAVRAARRSAVR